METFFVYTLKGERTLLEAKNGSTVHMETLALFYHN